MLCKLRWKAARPVGTRGLTYLELPFVLGNVLPHLLLHLLCAIYPQAQGLSECLGIKGFVAQVSALNAAIDVTVHRPICSTKMVLGRIRNEAIMPPAAAARLHRLTANSVDPTCLSLCF